MANIFGSPPAILPLPENKNRPLWSVMVPVYNCAKFLPQTLESILMQDIPEAKMQIEVVDDSSTDADVELLVNNIGKGRVRYYRQATNVGNLRNFETCLNRSQGRFIHLLHGDDKVRQGYYHKIEDLFRRYPEAGAAFTRYRYIDEYDCTLHDKRPEMQHEGILPNWLTAIGECQRIQYAAIVVKREVYEKLGTFYGPSYGEDWEMWVRIARDYPVAYSPEVLAEYRMHHDSVSGSKYRSGEHLQDLLTVMKLIQEHLPDENKQTILSKSRRYYASYGLKIAEKLWNRFHDREIVEAQIKQILNLDRSPKLYLLIALFYLKTFFKKA
ncbi:glycosyltransferase family 2 protein [Pontibacter ruber]|uniref:Glycosyltransferase family 2 protein n=1 Tax=Pontibacter ruber TaxID=1343895 RepID=A0ABW5CZX8_9BACT|nr:glycosyltransferase [Pontibacter ruber]